MHDGASAMADALRAMDELARALRMRRASGVVCGADATRTAHTQAALASDAADACACHRTPRRTHAVAARADGRCVRAGRDGGGDDAACLECGFEDAWALSVAVPGPPPTLLLPERALAPGAAPGFREARRVSGRESANPRRLSATHLISLQVSAEAAAALLGAGVAVGGALRAAPAAGAGSAEFVRGRAGVGAPFAPGGEPLENGKGKRACAVSDATLAAWLAVRGRARCLFAV